jgi:hypothetical protein
MIHRNINTTEWTRMAIDSLFDDGELEDWKELGRALKNDPEIARNTLRVCSYHSEKGSVELARVLVGQHFGDEKDLGLE